MLLKPNKPKHTQQARGRSSHVAPRGRLLINRSTEEGERKSVLAYIKKSGSPRAMDFKIFSSRLIILKPNIHFTHFLADI